MRNLSSPSLLTSIPVFYSYPYLYSIYMFLFFILVILFIFFSSYSIALKRVKKRRALSTRRVNHNLRSGPFAFSSEIVAGRQYLPSFSLV